MRNSIISRMGCGSRRSQAAMEFLLTYGWMILVVLAAIVGLAYFGVMSFSDVAPERCMLQAPFLCEDATVDESGAVTMRILNSGGFDANDLTVTLSSLLCNGTAAGLTVLADGDVANYVVDCNFSQGKLDAEIEVIYYRGSSGMSHKTTGSLLLVVE